MSLTYSATDKLVAKDYQSFRVSSTVSAMSGETVVNYGHVISVAVTSPTIASYDYITTLGTGLVVGTTYYSNFTSLVPGTIYYVRAYTTTNTTTYYGTVFQCGSDAGIINYGHVWNTSTNPTVANSRTQLGNRLTVKHIVPAVANFTGNVESYKFIPTLDLRLSNGFNFRFNAQWNALNNNSKLFDFGNGLNSDNITVSNSTTTNTLKFSIVDAAGSACITATVASAITVGTANNWIVSYSAGTVSIWKDGAAQTVTNTFVKAPNEVERTVNYIAKSTTVADSLFYGVLGYLDFYPQPYTAPEVMTYSQSMSGLANNTTYYVKSYVTTPFGTSYGNEQFYSTLTGLAYVNDVSFATTTTTATAISNVNTISSGTSITEHGHVWGTSENPTTASPTKTTLGARGTTGNFTSNITGLSIATAYSIRSYATTPYGTVYGPQKVITTKMAVTQYGHVWSSVNNPPTLADSKTQLGTIGATGPFTSSLTGLTSGTLYYIRAYTTTSIGTSYGQLDMFQTPVDITDSGFTYSSTINPPTISDSTLPLGPQQHSATLQATASAGINAGTTYYIRPYALTPTSGYSYGPVITSKVLTGLAGVTTNNITVITATGATLTGNIDSYDGADITAYGLIWDTSPNPTTALSTKIDFGARNTTGSFTYSPSGLASGTLWYVRAYATTAYGTTYGQQKFFTTKITVIQHGHVWSSTTNPPTITDSKTTLGARANGATGAFSSSLTGLTISTLYYIRPYTTTQSGTTYGRLEIFESSASITSSGFVWSSVNNLPTISDSIYGGGPTVPAVFNYNLISLTNGTTYYIRPYTTTVEGTGYGPLITSTTLTGLATVTTGVSSSILGTTATVAGNVTAYDGADATQYGHCWSTTTTPTVANSKTQLGAKNTTGTYNSNLTSLVYNTLYYVRAYVTTSAGTTYGTQITLTTQTGQASFSATNNSTIAATTIAYDSTITSLNGENITEHGHVWSTSPTPTTALPTKTTLGARSSTGLFSSNITGLSPSTTYYIRGYTTNAAGTVYDNAGVALTTLSGLATIGSTTISSILGTTASEDTPITNFNGGTVSQHGHVWDTVSGPTIALTTKTQLGSKATTGTISSSITGLAYATTYYTRAYATTEFGTSYGAETSFITKTGLATVTTAAVTVTPSTPVPLGGTIVSFDGENATQYGHVWNTSTGPTIVNSKTQLGARSTTGTFTSFPPGLAPVTTYYTRAYITTLAGTTYGNEQTFTTTKADQAAPSVPVASLLTGTSVTLTSDTNSLIVFNSLTQGTGTSFTGLTPGTTYLAYAYLPATTALFQSPNSANRSVTTSSVPPTVTMLGTLQNTANGLVLTGNVTNLGGENATGYGHCWSLSPSPTTSSSIASHGVKSAIGSFTSTVLGLIDGATYYFRAYATNTSGTSYSNEVIYTYIAGIRIASLTSTGNLRISGELIETGTHFHIDKNGQVNTVEFIEDSTMTAVMKVLNDGKVKIKGELIEGQVL